MIFLSGNDNGNGELTVADNGSGTGKKVNGSR